MKPTMATLVGGPEDGKAVEVFGSCWIKKMARFPHSSDFFDAVYIWDADGDKIIGKFKGYYRGATRVDRLGRRLCSSKP